MFGDDGTGQSLTGTWGWDGRSWKLLTRDGPAPRAHYALGYDPGRRRVVLFGGFRGDTGETVGDLWEFDGTRWRQLSVPGPAARAGARLAYVDELEALVLYGGSVGRSTYFGDTWAWDGTRWRLLTDAGPSCPGLHGDGVRRRPAPARALRRVRRDPPR